jgi:hypothetical protein
MGLRRSESSSRPVARNRCTAPEDEEHGIRTAASRAGPEPCDQAPGEADTHARALLKQVARLLGMEVIDREPAKRRLRM